jgi:guanylate kinase
MKKPILINFYAGPGSGKSTICAETFAKLKWLNINCEMALEWVKDIVWEENFLPLTNQMYITSQQQYRLFRLKDKVDVILTDSPLLQGLVYDQDNDQNLLNIVKKDRESYYNIDIFIERKKLYNPAGRTQTLDQALEKDHQIKEFLTKNSINFFTIEGLQTSIDQIVQIILKELNKIRFYNKILIITGSSGSGKTTVANKLLEIPDYNKITTYTTRAKRSEDDDYNFLTTHEFCKKISEGWFLEWEEVYENLYYGTSQESLNSIWNLQKLPILVMDVKGAIKLKEKLRNNCITVFLDVEEEVLKARLELRNTETPEWISKRLTRFQIENALKAGFDFIINNQNLEETYNSINKIVQEKWKTY